MFRIELLSAGRGDCLWIEYGNAERVHRVLIDGGVPSTGPTLIRRIEQLPPAQRHFELMVITHIDLDHIAGALHLLRQPPSDLVIDDIWFNGWKHLPADASAADHILGPKQGESISARIEQRRLPWNASFKQGAVVIGDQSQELPHITLPGEMTITLLSPYENRLRKLRRVWEAEIEKAGLTPGQAGRELETLPAPHEKEDEAILGEALNIDALAHSAFRADSSEANGSSIACMAEFEGRKCIFAGDAFAPDLTASIRKFAATAGTSKLKIDALKLAHHGGRKNTNVDLIQCLACEHFLFSTDGSYYQHPDQETIARILCHGHAGGAISLYFNHRVPETEMWQDRNLQRRFDYRTVYPIPTESGLIVELDA